MGYNKKNVVEYFPHTVNHGKKMFILRREFGNDGYAVWFMLLEQLGKADNHFLNLQGNTQKLYLLAEFQVTEDLFCRVVDMLVELGVFDKRLWEEATVIYSEKFTQSVAHVYERRINKCMQYHEICLQFLGNCDNIAKPANGIEHSIVKDSIVDHSSESDFEKFWDLYAKKVDRKRSETRWRNLTKKQKAKIFEVLPAYVKSRPDPQFRKDPASWLYNESWNNELLVPAGQKKQVFR